MNTKRDHSYKLTAFFIISIFSLSIISGAFAQMQMPTEIVPHYFGPYPNYANSPMPTGPVANIVLWNGGSGYSASPIVIITDVYGTGSGAIATATVVSGVITNITLVIPGSGYTAPIITINDPTGSGAEATAEIGPTLNGGIRKFVDSLPGLGPTGANNLGQYIPVGVPDQVTFPGDEYYEIAVVEYSEKMHSDLPPTRLRGYVQIETPANAGTSKHVALNYTNGSAILDSNGMQVYGYDYPHYLGPTIVANRDTPVRIKFTNYLPTGQGGNLFLPVDKTVMGAGMGPTDMPGMPGMKEEYKENRATLHLHGGFVPWISDGTPHQWTTPAGENTSYPKGVSVKYVPDMWFQNGNVISTTPGTVTPPAPGATNNPGDGSITFYYNNQQSARLQFYHDHSYGITRINVYAGEAAGYIIRDQVEKDMIDGTNLAGANPNLQKVIPADEIPLVIQDKTFVDASTIGYADPTWIWGSMPGMYMTGDLWMPHVYMPNQNPGDAGGMNAFGRWHYGPWFWPPTTGVAHGPATNPYYDPVNAPWEPPLIPGVPNVSMAMEAFMDTPTVNGAVYPYLEVDPKAYRFRILSVGNDRFFSLQFFQADPAVITADGRNSTEVRMVPAMATPGFPSNWPIDGRAGGVPDPTLLGPEIIQIGTEGGFLPKPVVIPHQPLTWNLDPTTFNFGNVESAALLLGPAERADVIVDFSQYAGKTLILYNDAPAAFPALDPRYDYYTGKPDLTSTGGTPTTYPGYGPNIRTVMQIRVRNITPASPYDVAALEAAFAKTATKNGVFETAQDPILVPSAEYNSAYNQVFPADTFVRIQDKNLTFTTLTGQVLTIPMENKAIQDEMGEAFETDYGRMSGMLGLELPSTGAGNQNFMLYGYGSPPVDIQIDSINAGAPVAGDGTTLWRVTHNGVDTHTLHFHLFNAQVVNRVAWDNSVRGPDLNELGWKETVRVNPLEDTIFVMRPVAPTQPFEVPNSIRLIDPTMPEGATLTGPPGGFIDPNAQPVTVTNHYVNFGWEYVMHCHLLGHEEMDMMHSVIFAVTPSGPPSGLNANLNGNIVELTWNDNSNTETNFLVQKATPTQTWTTIATLPNGTTAYNDTVNLSMSGSNYYRVTAANIVGDTANYGTGGFPTRSMQTAPSNTVTINLAGTCITTADNLPNGNGNGVIDMGEMLAHIGLWKSGTVTLNEMLTVINFWKIGVGC